MQFFAAPERFWSPREDSRMDSAMDWAVLRFWEEISSDARMMSMGFGGFGSLALDRKVSQRSGKRVAWHAWRISGAGIAFGAGFLRAWREVAMEEEDRNKKRERRERERREAMEKRREGNGFCVHFGLCWGVGV